MGHLDHLVSWTLAGQNQVRRDSIKVLPNGPNGANGPNGPNRFALCLLVPSLLLGFVACSLQIS